MKKLGMHVVRGQFLSNQSSIKLDLFDGKFDTAYKIVEFTTAMRSRSDQNPESAHSKLTTYSAPASGTVNWDWEDSREVAWSYCFTDSNTFVGADHRFNVVDPMNLIVEDLFLQGYSYNDGEFVNYMIIFEKYKLDEFDGPIAMVRNRAE